MYEVMIIDDDEEIRERLKLMIEWDRLEMRLSCEAGDSETAQELFLLYRPKIVITDINIPIINGLELAQKMAETDSEVRFIIITGYNDFEYVRSSVKLGAVDLISKPILPEEINKSLQTAAENFRLLRERQASLPGDDGAFEREQAHAAGEVSQLSATVPAGQPGGCAQTAQNAAVSH